MKGFTFSLSRFIGFATAKQKVARFTGIPTTKSGLYRKLGSALFKL